MYLANGSHDRSKHVFFQGCTFVIRWGPVGESYVNTSFGLKWVKVWA